MLSHRVGNGELTSLWFDKWYPLGSLVDTFGERVIYDSALLKDSKVARVISNNSWVWPVARSGAFMAIRDKLTQLPPPNNSCDRAVWDSSPNGVFSTKHTWQYLYGSQSTVPWYTLVWFRGLSTDTLFCCGWQYRKGFQPMTGSTLSHPVLWHASYAVEVWKIITTYFLIVLTLDMFGRTEEGTEGEY